jgi:hypothetical protein
MSLFKSPVTFLFLFFFISSSYPSMKTIFEVDEVERADDYYDRTHRQTFYHQGLYYVFYINDNSDLVYKCYNNEELVAQDALVGNVWSFADFSLVQEGNYVYLTYAVPEGMNFWIYFVLGKLNFGSIEWFSSTKLEMGDRPFIDLHNGKPVIVYSDGKEACFKWISALDEQGENWSMSNILIKWGSIDKDFFPAVYSLGDEGLMFIYWHGGRDRVFSIRYFQGNYSSPFLLYNCFDYLMEYQYFYYCWDTIVDRDNEVYFLNPAGEVMKWSPEIDEWELDKQLMSETGEIALGLSYENKSGELYLFSLYKGNGDFGYYRRNSTGWSEFTRLSNITNYKISGNINEFVLDGVTGIRWFGQGNGFYLIKFGIIDLKEKILEPQETVGGSGQNIISITSNWLPQILLVVLAGVLVFLLFDSRDEIFEELFI